MEKIIESPFTEGKADLQNRIVKMTFRNEEFEVYDFYYKCEKTGKEFSTSETGDVTMKQLYNQYREKNDILFPDQIKEMREKYGLSPLKMSSVLGFGPNIYKSYEKGDIPNKSNSTLLNVAKNPEHFFEIAKKSRQLSKLELENLKTITDQLSKEEKEFNLEKFLKINSEEIDQYSGYRQRNFEKFANMVLYFIRNGRTFTTRLNKYLFYADFLYYKQTGTSMSGYTYIAIENGPVPDDYKRLFGLLWERGFIENKEVVLGGNPVERFEPVKEFDKSYFSHSEIKILNLILKKFEYLKTDQIIEYSHNEKAWKDNVKGAQEISYQKYAFELRGL